MLMQMLRQVMLVAAVLLAMSMMTGSPAVAEEECSNVTGVDAQTGDEVDCSVCESEDGCAWSCDNGDHGEC